MDLETLETIGAFFGLIAVPVAAIWFWYTKVHRPEQQKRLDEAAVRNFTRQEGVRGFDEASQSTSLEQILSTQEQLIRHIIESNNGHLSQLTSKVIEGDKELSGELKKVVATLNFLVVLLSRNRATAPSIEGVTDWGDVSKVMEAIINSEEVQDITDLSSAAAGSKKEVTNDQ